MKKYVSIVCILLLCLTSCSSSSKSSDRPEYFRNTNWGMSKNEIKKIENANFITERSGLLCYSDVEIFSLSGFTLYYRFKDNELMQIMYLDKSSLEDFSLATYILLRSKLADLYGDLEEGSTEKVLNYATAESSDAIIKLMLSEEDSEYSVALSFEDPTAY